MQTRKLGNGGSKSQPRRWAEGYGEAPTGRI